MIAGLILAGLAIVAALGVIVLGVLLHRAIASQTVSAVPLGIHTK
jgi:hypothetical protein